MKYVILFLLIFSASSLLAQQPSISYLMCDEAKSQLQIRGAFGTDSGIVMIEDTTLGIVSWSDSLIICSLPDSGKGAGGGVIVQTVKGLSNEKALSIIGMTLDYYYWEWTNLGPGKGYGYLIAISEKWGISWRADITLRKINPLNHFPFEISKNSSMKFVAGHEPVYDDRVFSWTDSNNISDSTISVRGKIDLEHNQIILDTIVMKFNLYPKLYPEKYIPKSLHFDSLGNINGYDDSNGNPIGGETKRTYSISNTKILFPPSPKSIVIQQPQPNDRIKIWTENHSLIFHSDNPISSTTASLYSIDGRLLKREKVNISTAGNYAFDISSIHSHFGFLVLQTPKSVITRKVILQQ
jgi:hypothetical protein